MKRTFPLPVIIIGSIAGWIAGVVVVFALGGVPGFVGECVVGAVVGFIVAFIGTQAARRR
jgi:hypothetical protein